MNREEGYSSLFYFNAMSLIKILKIGYGIEGNLLDLTIAIPKGSYIRSFYVINQNDVQPDDSTKISSFDYIKAHKETQPNMSYQKVFCHKTDNDINTGVFQAIPELDYTSEDGTEYYAYELNPECKFNLAGTNKLGIHISQNNLTFITLKLSLTDSYDNPSSGNNVSQGLNWDPPQLGEDDSVLVYPLYNINALRLYALSSAKSVECPCKLPDEFVDRILQIRTIEMCLSNKNYYKASVFWNKFFKNKHFATNNKCVCHG